MNTHCTIPSPNSTDHSFKGCLRGCNCEASAALRTPSTSLLARTAPPPLHACVGSIPAGDRVVTDYRVTGSGPQRSRSNILPGFMMFCGSSACLIAACGATHRRSTSGASDRCQTPLQRTKCETLGVFDHRFASEKSHRARRRCTFVRSHTSVLPNTALVVPI